MIEVERSRLLRTFGATRHLIQKPMELKMKQAGVAYSMDQLILLFIVRKHVCDITQQDVAEIMLKDKSIILRMVDMLENDGLLKRVVDANDRRRNNLEVTEKGVALINSVGEIEAKLSEELLTGITEQEYATFQKVVSRIILNTQTM